MNTDYFITLHTNNMHVYSRGTRMFSSCVVVILWAFGRESYTNAFLIIQKHKTEYYTLTNALIVYHILV